MSDGAIVAIVAVFCSLLGAAIGAFGTIEAARVTGNKSSGCAAIGLIASITAIVGLVLGVFFGVFIAQQISNNTPPVDRGIGQNNEISPSSNVTDDIPLPLATMTQPVALPPLVQETPLSRGFITVPVDSSEGYRFTADVTGQYVFQYIDGVYSSYPQNQAPVGVATWSSGTAIYLNRSIQWDNIAISRTSPPDYALGDFKYVNTESEALNSARSRADSLTVSLNKDDYLIFVAIDEKPSYSDNPGQIIFEVLFLAEQ